MASLPKKRRMMVWVVRITLGAVLLIACTALAAWFAVERIPSWYQPIDVSQAELPRIRNSLPNTYQAINERIIAGDPFSFSLDQRTVTEWVVARGELYPESQGWLPPWVQDPVIRFDDGLCTFGARIDYQGWKTILGIHIAVEVDENEAVWVRIQKVTAGAVPVPLSRLTPMLDELLKSAELDPELMPDPASDIIRDLRERGAGALISEGIQAKNRFKTPNGQRWAKLESVEAEDGILRLGIRPE